MTPSTNPAEDYRLATLNGWGQILRRPYVCHHTTIEKEVGFAEGWNALRSRLLVWPNIPGRYSDLWSIVVEVALHELIAQIKPGLDSGNLLADARTAMEHLKELPAAKGSEG